MLNALSMMAAHDRSREMQNAAARRRLARLAACCRPGQLSVAGRPGPCRGGPPPREADQRPPRCGLLRLTWQDQGPWTT